MTTYGKVTQYTVTAMPFTLPEGWDRASSWDLTLRLHDFSADAEEGWRIEWCGAVLAEDLEWYYPSEARELNKKYQFTLKKARELAEEEAPLVQVNGRTAAQALEWREKKLAERKPDLRSLGET